MQLVSKDKKVSINQLREMASKSYYGLVKAVVDVEKQVMMIDAALHSDQEEELLKSGSKQDNLWGINLYPDKYGLDEFIEFDSMINLRPSQGNVSRGVDNPKIREKIRRVVNELVKND